MRIKVTETKVYKYAELTEKQKEKVLEKMYNTNVNFDWWDAVYDDAKNAGLKITGFDIDRGAYCKGNFIEDANFTADAIIKNHGDACQTYKDAKEFLRARDEMVSTWPKDENGEFQEKENPQGHLLDIDEELNTLESDFLNTILEDYRIMLSQEYEYLTSRKAIEESIESNEYEFDENGNIA